MKGESGGFTLHHSADLAKLCEKYGAELRQDVLQTATWLHDIGRLFDEKNHHSVSADIADGFLRSLGAGDAFIRKTCHCIREHGSSGSPKSPEAKLFRQLDAVSVFRWDFVLTYFLYFKSRKKLSELLNKQLTKISHPGLLKEAKQRFGLRFLAPGVKL